MDEENNLLFSPRTSNIKKQSQIYKIQNSFELKNNINKVKYVIKIGLGGLKGFDKNFENL
jgi:hypothetical protein